MNILKIQQDFLKGAAFYIKDKSSLIIVREDDSIVGIICPYIINEEGN